MNKGTEKIEQIDLSKLSRSELEDEFIKLYERCTAAEARAEHFMEEFRIAMQKRFGRSSEKEISDQITIAEYMKKEFGTASGCPSEDENLQNGEKEVRELINQAFQRRILLTWKS